MAATTRLLFWAVVFLTLGSVVPHVRAVNVTHFPHAQNALFQRRAEIGSSTDWLVSLNCFLPWQRVAIVASELHNILNGCFMVTSGVGNRTGALCVQCVFPIDDPATFAPEILRVVRELLIGENTTSKCTTGALFGIVPNTRTQTASPPPAVHASSVTVQSSAPWALDRINQRGKTLDGKYHYAHDGTGIMVYVTDSGIRRTRVGFGGRVQRIADFVDPPHDGDPLGHGTDVASAIGDALVGVCKNCSIGDLRVLGPDGTGYLSDVIFAVTEIADRQAASAHPAVLDMSLTGSANSMLDAYVNDLVTNWNVVVVVAAGNDGAAASLYSPARAASVLCVAASDINDQLPYWSNRGTTPKLVAPGDNLVLANHLSDTTYTSGKSGTSFAAPLVAGEAALIRQANPGLSAAAVQSLIVTRAGASGSVRVSSYPLLYTATGLPALSSSPPPPPPPPPGQPQQSSASASSPSMGFAAPVPAPTPRPRTHHGSTTGGNQHLWWESTPQAQFQLAAGVGSGPDGDLTWPPMLWKLLVLTVSIVLFFC
jgi:hypothetical protein